MAFGPVNTATLKTMHASIQNASIVAEKDITSILSARDLKGLTDDYPPGDCVTSTNYETSKKSVVNVAGVKFATNQPTEVNDDDKLFKNQTIKLIKNMLETVLTDKEMDVNFEDGKTVRSFINDALDGALDKARTVPDKNDQSLSALFPLSSSSGVVAGVAGGSKQRKKGGAPRAKTVVPPVIADDPSEPELKHVPVNLAPKLHVITVMLHISMALMLIVFISFDTKSLRENIFSSNPGESFVLGKRIAMFESKFNEAMTSCANPFSVFASSMGRRLFCKFYSEWVKVVSEFTAQTEESIIYSLFTGGTVLAGMGAVINKLRPAAAISFKAYTYFVMILAFVILYCITVLHFLCKTTTSFSWEFYRKVNNVLIKRIRKKEVGEEVVVVEEEETAAALRAQAAEDAVNAVNMVDAAAAAALENPISGLWSAGCKLLSTKAKALGGDEDLLRAAQILASLRETTGGGAKKKKTTSKKPTTPKSSSTMGKRRRASANRA